MTPDYRPPFLLRNAHLQSTLSSLSLRRPVVERRVHPVIGNDGAEILDCGDGVRLLVEHTVPAAAAPAGTAVLIHGWEGSARSMYMLSVAARLHAEGYRVVRLNLRDHGASHALNTEIFHSCRLPEVLGAVLAIRRRFPEEPLFLAGFSLGGNFALRVAAAAPEHGLELAGVVAICPVLDPRATLAALDNGLALYRLYFLRKWCASLLLKQSAFPGLYDFGELRRFRTLHAMTDYFVRHHTEYPDLESYLQGYTITGSRLAHLEIASHVLLADDDPVIPVRDAVHLPVRPQLTVTRSRFGGHCGFLANYSLHSWLDGYVARVLALESPGNRDRRRPDDARVL